MGDRLKKVLVTFLGKKVLFITDYHFKIVSGRYL